MQELELHRIYLLYRMKGGKTYKVHKERKVSCFYHLPIGNQKNRNRNKEGQNGVNNNRENRYLCDKKQDKLENK